jgi:hypothetical protein
MEGSGGNVTDNTMQPFSVFSKTVYISFFCFVLIMGCTDSRQQSCAVRKLTDSNANKTPVVNKQPDTTKTNEVIDTVKHDTVAEEKAFDVVRQLPEMYKFFKLVDSVNKGQRHAMLMIGSTPTKEEPYYLIQVGEDNGMVFVTEYNFYVYYPSLRIKFYDTVHDTAISLKEWRKRGARM